MGNLIFGIRRPVNMLGTKHALLFAGKRRASTPSGGVAIRRVALAETGQNSVDAPESPIFTYHRYLTLLCGLSTEEYIR
jgi:hypothetical protein